MNPKEMTLTYLLHYAFRITFLNNWRYNHLRDIPFWKYMEIRILVEEIILNYNRQGNTQTFKNKIRKLKEAWHSVTGMKKRPKTTLERIQQHFNAMSKNEQNVLLTTIKGIRTDE